MANFLTLDLGEYAVDLAEDELECAVYESLFDLATQPLPPEDNTTLGNEEGSVKVVGARGLRSAKEN